jgi:hypothetical protein
VLTIIVYKVGQAMQLKPLLHGQITAMTHPLLTISDISKAPESEDASQLFYYSQRQGQ